MNPSRRSPPLSDELQPVLRLAHRTMRAWRVGLATFAGVIVVTLTVGLLWPKQYRSDAVVYYREGMQWSPSEGANTRRVGQRLKDMLLARAQLAKVIEELGLYKKLVKAGRMAEAVEEMRLATSFKFDQSDVFVISYAGESPEEAQRVTTRLTDVLIAENARSRSEQAHVTGTFLESEKKRNEAELGAKEGALLRFLTKHPEFAQEQVAMGGTMRARTRRDPESIPAASDIDSTSLAALRREEDRLRRQISAPGPRAPQDPTLVTAKNDAEVKLRAAQRELIERRATFTDQHPDVRAAEAMAKAASDAYRRASEAVEAVEPAVLKERLAQVERDIAAYRRSRQREIAAPDAIVTSETAQRIVVLEAEWARLSREVAEARERAQQLETRQFTAAMSASMATSEQTAQIVVIDPAYAPARPIGITRLRLVLLSLAMAFAFGIGSAMLAATMDDRLCHRDDVERLELAPVLMEVPQRSLPQRDQGGIAEKWRRRGDGKEEGSSVEMTLSSTGSDARATASPVRALASAGAAARKAHPASRSVGSQPASPAMMAQAMEPSGAAAVTRAAALQASALGSVPELVHVHYAAAAPIDPSIIMLHAPESPGAASFRILRHRLTQRDAVRTLLVTSPEAGEGKTLCAVNLALALGEAGRARVLLLEASFQSPSLARLFGVVPPVCIGEQLALHRVNSNQPWTVVETAVPWLHTAAVTPGGAARPILDSALALFFAEFRRTGYDYIVIDGPPILGSADVNLIGESVDGVLMAIWAGKSRAQALTKAIDQIGRDKFLGVALLGT